MTNPAPHPPRFGTLAAGSVGLLIFFATAVAYGPALRGGLLWDDDYHVTRPELQSVRGLERIWFELGATAQYYPVLHSAFWVEHRLWGDATLGYHLANVALHALAACLFILVLRRLSVPGAVLAGFIFALHPVGVESVAWISEQKNTLSTVFYLLAALAYLRFDGPRGQAATAAPTSRSGSSGLTPYLLASALFILALLSKSVTATLPAALLVVFWWQRGRLSWRREIGPLVPWFALAVASGLFTAWVERRFIGAQGAPFALSFTERCLLAGRVIWFYLGKLLWPSPLIFIYPRWMVSASQAWQYLFPLAALGVLAGLWLARNRTRAPLAAALFFVGTLFPALGFFNVYPFIFSYVADHFQYLASLGIIALAAAGCDLLLRGQADKIALARRDRNFISLTPYLLVGVLGVLTWRQSRIYRDGMTLYRTTIERNPECWMAYANLGTLLAKAGQTQDALAYYGRALQINPDSPEAHVDLGAGLRAMGKIREAIDQYQWALRLRPGYAEAHNNLGNVLRDAGRLPEAIAAYRAAVKVQSGYADAHSNLGNALRESGQLPEAIAEGQRARDLAPADPVVRNDLGIALMVAGRLPEAMLQLQEAVRLRPSYADAQNNLGSVLRLSGDQAAAQLRYEEAIRLSPGFAEAHYNLGVLLAAGGRMPEAIAQLEEAVRLRPDYPAALNNLGNALRVAGRNEEAVARYEAALRLHPEDRQVHYNLSLLLHALGRDREAAEQLRLSQR